MAAVKAEVASWGSSERGGGDVVPGVRRGSVLGAGTVAGRLAMEEYVGCSDGAAGFVVNGGGGEHTVKMRWRGFRAAWNASLKPRATASGCVLAG